MKRIRPVKPFIHFVADIFYGYSFLKYVILFESRHLPKIYKMGDIANGVANTLLPAKKKGKKYYDILKDGMRHI